MAKIKDDNKLRGNCIDCQQQLSIHILNEKNGMISFSCPPKKKDTITIKVNQKKVRVSIEAWHIINIYKKDKSQSDFIDEVIDDWLRKRNISWDKK